MTSQSLQPFVYTGYFMKFIIQKQTCFIYLEQTERAIHFDLGASCTNALE